MKFFSLVLAYMTKKNLGYFLVEPYDYVCVQKFRTMEFYVECEKNGKVCSSEAQAMDKFDVKKY